MTTESSPGRLSRPPNPVLFELLYEPHYHHDLEHVLRRLLLIDAAHVLMLARREILGRDTAAGLIAVNRDLQQRLARGEEVLAPPALHRGLYLHYEQHYISRLGALQGGAAHVARSRNDINSTLTRMRLRDELLALCGSAAELIDVTLDLAARHTETLMSAFTHLQPAQPSTLAHYLAAVAAESLRSAEALAATWEDINRCPMGAAAGMGTSFAIERQTVAELLGFPAVIDNSLDAVASRDYVIRVLAALAMLGSTLTRWGQDFQLWGNYAHGFLAWPDDLVSTSSIMPQKRNAYVWENIRGQAIYPVGAWVNALTGMKNTPFSNSVEVSGEATAHLWPALAAIDKALRLTHLLVRNVEVRPDRMRQFLDGAETTMTALADRLVVRQGLAFRTAHDVVGKLVARRGDEPEWPSAKLRATLEEILGQETGQALVLDEEEIDRALDPAKVLAATRYGGGPAPDSVRLQLRDLRAQAHRFRERIVAWRERLAAADGCLNEAMDDYLQGPPEQPVPAPSSCSGRQGG